MSSSTSSTAISRTTRVKLLPVCHSFSIYGHFPRGPGSAGTKMSTFRILLELRTMEVVVTTDVCKRCKAPVKASPPTNQNQIVYRPDALPVAQPTASKHWRESITFHGPAHPKFTCGLPVFQPCLWPLKAPDYLKGGCPRSRQPSDAGIPPKDEGKLCYPLTMRAIPERLRDVSFTFAIQLRTSIMTVC